jgi:hypothetical protein
VLHNPRQFDRGCLGGLRAALRRAGSDDGRDGGDIYELDCSQATRASPLGDEALMSGSITLGEVAEHTAVLAVACSRCDRAGLYNLETLITRHGAEFGIPDLLRLLSDDCPKRASVSAYDLCL